MKFFVTAVLLATLAFPASAAIVHDESVDGDLSSNAASPTPLAFALGSNIIMGSTSNLPANPGERDYITFTIPAGRKLSALNLLAYTPDNLSFASFNAGATSFVPSAATNGSFLSGIHIGGPDLTFNLMPFFVSRAVTTNALPAPELGPGTYCFLIQRTSAVLQQYSLEFVITEAGVPAEATSWGAVKNVYR